MTPFEIFACICMGFSVLVLAGFLYALTQNFYQQGHYEALQESLQEAQFGLAEIKPDDATVKVGQVLEMLQKLRDRRIVFVREIFEDQP